MSLPLQQTAADAAAKCGRVAVLMGGDSAEREVSLNSGNAVYRALLDAGVNAIPVDLRDCDFHQLAGLEVDRVFNVLHGRGGEDGTIRAVLDFLGIPSTGSGVCAAALTMNKVLTKKVIRCSGIPTPDFFELRSLSDCQRLLSEFGLPVFVKPVAEGSSIGMTPVYRDDELIPAWEAASRYGAAFAEKFVDGGEYTAGFIAGEVLPLIKLETPREFYDYEAKYLSDETRYHCPSGLSSEEEAELSELALWAFRSLGCTVWGRVDTMRGSDGRFYVLEVNTIPGMTSHSLVPMAAAAAGLDIAALVQRIVDLSWRGVN